MSNFLYTVIKDYMLQGQFDWPVQTIKAVLVNATYIPNVGHTNMTDVSVPARIATSGALVGKTVNGGIVDADDLVFAAVPSGNVAIAVILYRDGPSDAARILIAYLDIATGLPITTTGGDISVIWSDGTNKMFRL